MLQSAKKCRNFFQPNLTKLGYLLGIYLRMQKMFKIEQGVPEIWGFKGLEIILLRETKKGENTTAVRQL